MERKIYRWSILEKIDDAKYNFYEYFDSTQKDAYNEKLDKLHAAFDSVEKEYHHWACYDQGDHGSKESKGKKLFTGKTPIIKPI
eukprot:gene4532-7909_t